MPGMAHDWLAHDPLSQQSQYRPWHTLWFHFDGKTNCGSELKRCTNFPRTLIWTFLQLPTSHPQLVFTSKLKTIVCGGLNTNYFISFLPPPHHEVIYTTPPQLPPPPPHTHTQRASTLNRDTELHQHSCQYTKTVQMAVTVVLFIMIVITLIRLRHLWWQNYPLPLYFY